jgi:hypothetical protein
MDTQVWIYFSKTGTGFEIKGTDIISGFDAFLNTAGTYLVEYSYSDLLSDMHFFIYEWDNSQKKRRTVYEAYQRELVLMGLVKNVNIPDNVKQAIIYIYVDENEELELEKNANS